MKETQDLLAEVIEKLSEKERLVVTLYYYEELTINEIAGVVGVTQSRISQIHTKALRRLQAVLGKYKSLLFLS